MLKIKTKTRGEKLTNTLLFFLILITVLKRIGSKNNMPSIQFKTCQSIKC